MCKPNCCNKNKNSQIVSRQSKPDIPFSDHAIHHPQVFLPFCNLVAHLSIGLAIKTSHKGTYGISILVPEEWRDVLFLEDRFHNDAASLGHVLYRLNAEHICKYTS